MSRLRDLDIRQALHARLELDHADEPDTIVVDEMGLCQGIARVDVAVVNGAINGFEIKSEADRLDRLAAQRAAYCTVLDTVTLVTCAKHLPAARRAVPRWWGLQEARRRDADVVLATVRRAGTNPNVDPAAVARLLWRDEALLLLARHELDAGLRSKPRRALWHALATQLDPDVLATGVRTALKRRPAWRAAT